MPAGWRFSTQDDYRKFALLETAQIPTDTIVVYGLISKTTWNIAKGTNKSGFDAVAAGQYIGATIDKDFNSIEMYAIFYAGDYNFILRQLQMDL